VGVTLILLKKRVRLLGKVSKDNENSGLHYPFDAISPVL
jgi:hypothetical protein